MQGPEPRRALRRIQVNLETREKSHVVGRGCACPVDGYVCFRNSELLTGRVGKASLGGGNKAGLFQVHHPSRPA